MLARLVRPDTAWAGPRGGGGDACAHDSLGSSSACVVRCVGATGGEPVMSHSRARLHGEVHVDAVHPSGMVDTTTAQYNEATIGEADLTDARWRPSEGRWCGGRQWSR
jgi:hypothetical protein